MTPAEIARCAGKVRLSARLAHEIMPPPPRPKIRRRSPQGSPGRRLPLPALRRLASRLGEIVLTGPGYMLAAAAAGLFFGLAFGLGLIACMEATW